MQFHDSTWWFKRVLQYDSLGVLPKHTVTGRKSWRIKNGFPSFKTQNKLDTHLVTRDFGATHKWLIPTCGWKAAHIFWPWHVRQRTSRPFVHMGNMWKHIILWKLTWKLLRASYKTEKNNTWKKTAHAVLAEMFRPTSRAKRCTWRLLPGDDFWSMILH